MTHYLRAIWCWLRGGHDYSEWRSKGSKGQYAPYRICHQCGWVQPGEETGTSERR